MSDLSQNKESIKKLNNLLSKLKKDFPYAIRDVKISGQVEKIILSSPQINYLFGGGLPVGRIIQLQGPESSGKSTLSCYFAAQIQKQPTKNIVVYVDFERSFVEEHANQIGLDTSPDKFIFLRPENGEEAFTILEDLIRTNMIGLIILDSDATMPTKSQLIEVVGKSNFGGTARLSSEALKKLNPLLEKYKTTLIWISQERDNIKDAMFGPDFRPTGGTSIKFYASARFRVTKVDSLKEKDEIIGIEMKIKNLKNKVSIPFREALMKLYYKGGFDIDSEYLNFFIKFGLISQNGAYYKSEEFGFNLQGKTNLIKYLNEHPEIYNTLKNRVNETISKTTAEDINNEKEFFEKGELNYEKDIDEIPDIPDISEES